MMRAAILALFLLLALFWPQNMRAESVTAKGFDTSPLELVRSLQRIQDDVVLGDHSAVAMQRYLLALIDDRLRDSGREVFESRSNVEAALIYAMSGGNPDTLTFLAARDGGENFDKELVSLLEVYFDGHGAAVYDRIVALLPSYAGSRLEPYLMLIAGNIAAGTKPKESLRFLDWARLLSPGTIVEEAALRRSIAVARDLGQIVDGLERAEQYGRRFLHSPYASQFADMVVDLALAHPAQVESETIQEILSEMDMPRRRSIYLRIARRAAIAGERDLALETAAAAREIGGDNEKVSLLADLYAGVADIATRPEAVDTEALSPRDVALQRAREAVSKAITAPPAITVGEVRMAPAESGEEPAPQVEVVSPTDSEAAARDYVEKGQAVLDDIDQLLGKDR